MATQRVMVTEAPKALQDLPGVRVGDIIVVRVDGLSGCLIGQYLAAPPSSAPGVRLSAYSPGNDDQLTILPNSDPEKDWVWIAPGKSETSLIVLNQSPN